MSDLQKRVKTWSNFAVALNEAERNLSLGESELSNKLTKITPSKENVKDCENLYEESKKDLKSLIEIRKSKTDPLDNLKARLMQFEKNAKANIDEFGGKLLEVKKELEKERQKEQFKADEIAEFIRRIEEAAIEYREICEKKVHQKVYTDYNSLLENDVDFIEYDKKVQEMSDVQIPLFADIQRKHKMNRQYLSDGEAGTIYTNNKPEFPDYRKMYIDLMMEKKSGYRSELANKEEAKKRMYEERKKAEQERERIIEMEKLEAKMNQSSTPEVSADYKATKKVYEVDMEESPENALKLYACFSANFDLALQNLNVKKWFSLTPNQIAKALGKAKSKNNSLEFQGITFKIVDKL